MKVLVIGTGGREHALAHTFWRQGHEVYSYPGNPGIFQIASPLQKKIESDLDLMKAMKEEKIDLAVVGSETDLERGMQDLFSSHGLALFGPSRQAAMIESSKSWSKSFMSKYHIPTPRFIVCSTSASAKAAVRSLFAQKKKAVVKASGLAAGKGVFCCQTEMEAQQAIKQVMEEKIFGHAGSEVVVEELISGPELSLQILCDGKQGLPLIAAQDHKRLNDRDEGPNTGGMGAYAPLPFLSPKMQEEINDTIVAPTLRGLKREKIDYRGVLYFGLMLTREGPKVLEYNSRLGDPEAQAILPLIDSDLAQLMLACARGDLGKMTIQWKPQASCCVVLASAGYPGSFATGCSIGKLPDRYDLFFFHAGTALDADGNLVTARGRVLSVTGVGKDWKDAIQKTYAAIDAISCPWAHFRRDIGRAARSATV
jgi:phosphoribosylamine--glycine ligase